MVIYSGFSHEKWWFSLIFHSYVSLPEGNPSSIYVGINVWPPPNPRDRTHLDPSRPDLFHLLQTGSRPHLQLTCLLWYPKSSPNASISGLNPTCMQIKFTFQEVNSLNEIILMCMYNCIISTLVLAPRVPSARRSHTAFPSSRVAAVLIFHQKLMSFVAILILW